MLYVKTEDLKIGMRLARPIYNRNGTLLYERNSKLTQQGIISVKNFGLIGLFILEPAEPVPPMSKEDLEFERFQTMSVFTIKEELENILNKQESKKINTLANQIVKQYGNLYNKINFMQNLRSRADYIYKHAINSAILCALISHQLEFTYEEQFDVVMAALLHDMYKLTLPDEMVEREFSSRTADDDNEQAAVIKNAILNTQNLIKNQVMLSSNVKQIITQFHHNALSDNELLDEHLLKGTRVLRVAEGFDNYTAMKSYTEPTSEVTALRSLYADKRYAQEEVRALTDSIHILASGVCVTLTNNDKGIVIVENDADVLRPVILSFTSNVIMDLSLRATFGKVQVLDVMKTMDNRFVMGEETVDKFFSMGGGVNPPTAEEIETREAAKVMADKVKNDAIREQERILEAAQMAEKARLEEEAKSIKAAELARIEAEAAAEEAKAAEETAQAVREAAMSKIEEVDPFGNDGEDNIDIDSLFDF